MKKKLWTIFFYLNGNNDLGIEMENTFLDIISNNNYEDINIIIQIGKAPINLVNLIRQSDFSYKEEWTGVRRYSLIDKILNLEESFDVLNMANYKALGNFIEWGTKKFPAEKYMVVISGHGFVATVLSNLCSEKIYTMGLYEMGLALKNLKKSTKINIDILTLDVCNLNSMELLYELGRDKENIVKNVLTYVNSGPLSGMKFSELIPLFNSDDPNKILKIVISKSTLNLVAIDINHNKLERIRNLSKSLASETLLYHKDKLQSRKELLDKYHNEINKLSKKLIISYKNTDKSFSLLYFICFNRDKINDIKYFSELYNKLSFVKSNPCSNLLTLNIDNKLIIEPSKPSPIILQKENLILYLKLYNPYLNEEKINTIINKIYK